MVQWPQFGNHLQRARRHHVSCLPLIQTRVLLNHWVWQQTVGQLENKVNHNQSWLHGWIYLKPNTVNSFVTTVHYSLVYYWSCDGWTVPSINPKHCCSGCSLACTAAAKDSVSSHTRSRSLNRWPNRSYTSSITWIQITYNWTCSIMSSRASSLHTTAKIMLGSHSVRPNKGTRSQSLFGYVSLRNMTISASIPVVVVPSLQTYQGGTTRLIGVPIIFRESIKLLLSRQYWQH